VLLGVTATDFTLDTASINHVPHAILIKDSTDLAQHPTLRYFRSRVEVSNEQTNYYKRLMYPTFSFSGVLQGRGSGFDPNYVNNQNAFTNSYSDGINPTRGNYLFAIGVVWNLSSILKTTPQVRAQRYTTYGLENEYNLADQQLHAQLALSETKIQNAMANYMEAPEQVKAAAQAYLQKSVQYKNGLATLVDLTQALFVLNRAETDRDIAYTNVWQALLLKSAAEGDYNIFINEF
jgi:outer membrane protein TolC